MREVIALMEVAETRARERQYGDGLKFLRRRTPSMASMAKMLDAGVDPRKIPTPTPHIGHARLQQMACVSGSSLGLTRAAPESVVLHGLRG